MRLLCSAMVLAFLVPAISACGDDAKATADTLGADTAAPTDTVEPVDTASEDDTATPADDSVAPEDAAEPDAALDVDGADAPSCVVDCPEGEVRCATGSAGVETCVADANGCTHWGDAVACTGADVCQAGACVAACTAADDRCLNDTAEQRCVGGQLIETGCAFGCDPLTAACRPCVQGAWRCNTTGGTPTLELCQSGGTWSSTGPCIDCACGAGTPVTMRCLGKDDTATSCATCGDDGQICVP